MIDDYSDQGIVVDFAGPPHLVFFGRPVGIKRITANLLENAVKYAKRPCIKLSSDTCSVRIEVSDEGPGIPESELENVFPHSSDLNPLVIVTPVALAWACPRLGRCHACTAESCC